MISIGMWVTLLLSFWILGIAINLLKKGFWKEKTKRKWVFVHMAVSLLLLLRFVFVIFENT
jgi:uncharacterized membrane protein YraQ (UPF0718 family)